MGEIRASADESEPLVVTCVKMCMVQRKMELRDRVKDGEVDDKGDLKLVPCSKKSRAEDGSSRAHAACFEALVNAGADVNATTNSGDAACHVAAREGLHDVLCRLLEFGANMMLENSDGLTPAEVAYVELQGDSSKDAAALQRCHELLA